jgi:hypothetical protein
MVVKTRCVDLSSTEKVRGAKVLVNSSGTY